MVNFRDLTQPAKVCAMFWRPLAALALRKACRCTSRYKMAPDAAGPALLLLLLSVGWCRGEYSSQALSTFVDTLLAEYDRAVAPRALTVVSVAIDVRHAAVYDASASMRLLADVKMNWSDPRLTWNATLWDGDSVLVSTERLWAPDVVLVNAGGGGGAGGGEVRARLAADGAVAAVQRLDLHVPLALQLRDWPRDVQEAVFKFASRMHGDDEIDLVLGEFKNSVVVESGAWKVVTMTGSTWTWQRGEETTRGVSWSVQVARRGAARAVAAGAVLAAAGLTLAAAVALPFPQRPPLAACAAFLAAIWLITAIFHVPASATTPRVMCVMCALCVVGAACGACAAAAARLARRTTAPPRALRALLSRISAVYTLAPDPESAGGSQSGAWAAAAQLLDAVVAGAVLLALAVLAAVHLFS